MTSDMDGFSQWLDKSVFKKSEEMCYDISQDSGSKNDEQKTKVAGAMTSKQVVAFLPTHSTDSNMPIANDAMYGLKCHAKIKEMPRALTCRCLIPV